MKLTKIKNGVKLTKGSKSLIIEKKEGAKVRPTRRGEKGYRLA